MVRGDLRQVRSSAVRKRATTPATGGCFLVVVAGRHEQAGRLVQTFRVRPNLRDADVRLPSAGTKRRAGRNGKGFPASPRPPIGRSAPRSSRRPGSETRWGCPPGAGG
jgi:hypothetical protein